MKLFLTVTIFLFCFFDFSGLFAKEIPYFARKYDLTCESCHVSVPTLGERGMEFRSNGYRIEDRSTEKTIPVSVWISTRTESIPNEEAESIKNYLNRIEFVSGGRVGTDRISYFVEWRALSMEVQPDGNLRDRSGRFEDLFFSIRQKNFELTIGQFRQIDQVDVSLRPGVSEPTAFSSSIPGPPGRSGRKQALRAFSPSGRSPAVRVGYTNRISNEWNWINSVSVPFPGEFSIPLTGEARRNASNEFELNPKGILLESFVQSGLNSYGGHFFYGAEDRFLANAVATGNIHDFQWTAAGGIEKIPGDLFGRISFESLYYPHRLIGVGARFEDRIGLDNTAAFSPFANINFPGTKYTVRLTVEQKFRNGNSFTMIELGTVF